MRNKANLNLSLETDNLNRKMVHGFTWTTVERWTKRLLSIAVIAVLARLLSRTDFGLVAAAAILIDYFSTFVGQGLGLAVIQRKDLEPEHLNAMFWLNMTFAMCLTGLTWILAPYLSTWIDTPDAAPVVRWLSLGLVLQAFSRVQTALLTRQMRFEALACVNVVSSLAGGVTGVVMAFLGFGVWSLVAQQLTGALLSIFILFFVTGWWPAASMSNRHIRELYRFSLYVFLDQQFLFLSRRLDEALILGFFGAGGLGLYSIAKRIVLLLQESLEAPLSTTFIPAFSKLQNSLHQLSQTGETSFKISCMLVLPFFTGLIALAPEAVNLVFGPRWADAVPYVRILAAGSVFIVLNLIISSIFLAVGKPFLNLLVTGTQAAMGAILLPIGSLYGALGIPIAFALRNMFGTIFITAVFKKKIEGVSIHFLSGLFRPLLASILMALAARLVGDMLKSWDTLWIAAASILTGIGVYTFLILLLNRSLLLKCFETARGVLTPTSND